MDQPETSAICLSMRQQSRGEEPRDGDVRRRLSRRQWANYIQVVKDGPWPRGHEQGGSCIHESERRVHDMPVVSKQDQRGQHLTGELIRRFSRLRRNKSISCSSCSAPQQGLRSKALGVDIKNVSRLLHHRHSA